MDNTIQLYTDEERTVKGYPITSPDRVIDEDGVSIKKQIDDISEQLDKKVSNYSNINPFNQNKCISEILGVQGLIGADSQKSIPFIKWTRLIPYWAFIEQENGEYIFNAPNFNFDEYISEAERYNRKIIVCFETGQGDEWFNRKYPSASKKFSNASDSDLLAFINFVKATVSRYKNKNIVWEMYNEPSLNANIMKMVEMFSNAVKSIDKHCKVIAPSYDACNGYNLLTGPNSIHDLLNKGLMDYVDGVSMHNYNANLPIIESDDDRLRGLRNVLSSKGYNGAPIYITEWAYSLTNLFEDNTKILSDKEQGDYLQILYNQCARYGVICNIWHVLRNSPDEDSTTPGTVEHQEANFGLLKHDFTKKPTYHAMNFISKSLKNAFFKRQVATSSIYLRAFEYEINGLTAYYYFSNIDGGETFKIEYGDKIQNMEIDYSTGNIKVSTSIGVNGIHEFRADMTPKIIIFKSNENNISFTYPVPLSQGYEGDVKLKINSEKYIDGVIIKSDNTNIESGTVLATFESKLNMKYSEIICMGYTDTGEGRMVRCIIRDNHLICQSTNNGNRIYFKCKIS